MEHNILPFVGGIASGLVLHHIYGGTVHNKDNAQLSNVKRSYNHDITDEYYSRIISFFGEEKFHELTEKFVIVVGLGGVGSHTANMLVRSGIRKIRLIDFDQVTLSSLNRHAVANLEDVGISKVEALERHFKKIAPWCEVEALPEMFRWDEASRLLNGSPDFVLDCIDDVNTKAELITFCVQRGIPVLTSMGAAGKADPTRIRIGTLGECIKDPLASKLKWKLKKHSVCPNDVLAVYSVEKPICTLIPLTEEQATAPSDFGAVEHFRLRVLPVLGTSPAVFGQTMASYVLCCLGGMKYEPESGERTSKNLRHKMRQMLIANETKRSRGKQDLEEDIDDDDLEFVVQQVWKNKCAITNRRMGGTPLLVLARWNMNEPISPWNLVFILQSEYAKLIQYDATSPNSENHYQLPIEVIDFIHQRLNWAKSVYDVEYSNKALQSTHMQGIGDLDYVVDRRKRRPGMSGAFNDESNPVIPLSSTHKFIYNLYHTYFPYSFALLVCAFSASSFRKKI